MAIVWTAARITGLSTDTKPTNVPVNRVFFETDTLLEFNFNGSTWDQSGGGGGVIEDSEYEELFDNTLKIQANSPYLKVFDPKGAKALILFQKSTKVSSPARSKVSSQNWTSADAPIDDDLNSATGHNYVVAGFSGGSPQQGIYIIDFGSIAVRDINCKSRASMSCNSSGSGSRNVQVNIEYSTDDISYSGGGVVVNAAGAQSGGQDNTATRSDLAVNMRYARMYTTGSGGGVCNGYGSVYETWVPGLSLGSSQLSFEVYDDLNTTWKTIDFGFGTITAGDSNAGNEVEQTSGMSNTEIRNFPKSPTKVRCKMVVTDGVDTKVGIMKVYG